MRADNDVHLSCFHAGQDGFLLARGAKPAEQVNPNWKRGEAAAESFKVLESQHRSWSEHGHLLGVGDRLERGAHSYFRLAVAHVAAKQAVHGLLTLHIALDIPDGDGLVRRFFKLEGVFKFPLELSVRRKREALSRFPAGVQPQ